jgi:hypothetical protein
MHAYDRLRYMSFVYCIIPLALVIHRFLSFGSAIYNSLVLVFAIPLYSTRLIVDDYRVTKDMIRTPNAACDSGTDGDIIEGSNFKVDMTTLSTRI